MSALHRVLGVSLLCVGTALAVACAPTGTAASGGSASAVAAPDPSNATFKIDKETVTLTNGRAERDAAPGSAKAVAALTDKRVTGDIDGDGRTDAIVILTYQPGGSGTFYYVAALLNASAGVNATSG